MLSGGDVGGVVGQNHDPPLRKCLELLEDRADNVSVDVFDRFDLGFIVRLVRGFIIGVSTCTENLLQIVFVQRLRGGLAWPWPA